MKLGVHRYQKHGVPAGSTPHDDAAPGEPPASEGPTPSDVGGSTGDETRPKSDGKRSMFSRRARTTREAPTAAPTRPSSSRRVSTAPFASDVIAFAAGGLDRLGQGPLAMTVGFTAPVAGQIVDETITGTVADKLVQPLVRGSEKYRNLGALVGVWAAVAWASNNPENAEAAYGIYHRSMMVILPLAGKEMVARAKAEKKAAEALAEILPELRELGLGDDPIRGLWETAWRQPVRVPDHMATPTDVPA